MTSIEEISDKSEIDNCFKSVICNQTIATDTKSSQVFIEENLKRTLHMDVTEDSDKTVQPVKKRKVDFHQSSKDHPQERMENFDFMSDCLLLRYPLLEFSLSRPPPPYLLTNQTFKPEKEIQDQLSQILGITSQVAEKSLYWSGNCGFEAGIHDDCYTGLSEVTQFSWIPMPRNLNAYPRRIKSLLFSACEWLCNRHPVTWNTPLEVEISMLRTELEDRSQDVRDRLCSSDSGYVSVRDEEDLDPLEQHPRIKLHGLVLVVNGCMTVRNHVLMKLISSVTIGIISKLSSYYSGEYQLRQWERLNQSIKVVRGENSRHLEDIQLASDCLGLETQDTNFLVLGVWGDLDVLDLVVGRLPEYPTSC